MKWLAVVALSVLAGCASAEKNARRQVVLITSEPPGAAILSSRGEVIEHTPAFVEVERRRRPEVSLRTEQGTSKLTLATNYRWRDSFFSNFLFLTYAPIGWFVDILTGAAWDVEDPATAPVELARADKQFGYGSRRYRPREVAIAPPQSVSQGLSDETGRQLSIELAARGQRLKSYASTLPEFLSNGYDFDGRSRLKERNRLYFDLGVDKVYESEVQFRDGRYVVEGRYRDIYTDEIELAPPLHLSSAEIDTLYSPTKWWTRVLPNSVGVTFLTGDQLRFDGGNGKSYSSQPVTGDVWWAQGLRYLSAIEILNLPVRRPGRSSRWVLGAVPIAKISRRKFKITDLPPQAGRTEETFTRWLLAGGYALEVGFQTGRHFFFLDFGAIGYWSEIHFSESGRETSTTTSGLGFQSEAGYVYFVNSNWFARLFTRTSTESNDGWSRVMKDRLGPESSRVNAQELVSGLTFGYRFEPSYAGLRLKKASTP